MWSPVTVLHSKQKKQYIVVGLKSLGAPAREQPARARESTREQPASFREPTREPAVTDFRRVPNKVWQGKFSAEQIYVHCGEEIFDDEPDEVGKEKLANKEKKMNWSHF